jgi:hypothetical protein
VVPQLDTASHLFVHLLFDMSKYVTLCASKVRGTTISGTSTSGFAAAMAAARSADAIVFAGGIDESVEAEGNDRTSIEWPGVQLRLIQNLATVGKPLVVVQFGGGQVDNTALKSNSAVCGLSCKLEYIFNSFFVRSIRLFGQVISVIFIVYFC